MRFSIIVNLFIYAARNAYCIIKSIYIEIIGGIYAIDKSYAGCTFIPFDN